MRQFDKRMDRAHRQLKLKVGHIYENCSYHPVLCLGVDYKRDEIWGISLIDGTYPHSCSLIHCGVRKLSPKQAWNLKMRGPDNLEDKIHIRAERRWWNKSTEKDQSAVRFVGPHLLKPPRKKQPAVAKRK